ncbi:DUF4190 domain-containing protein [Paenarthrobacter sp. NPDC089675]|uniref:DUF4190 domain-containing protein n=1 Tax=Paenarthrobacter sp. NPDC089675 TaxID=3364376 RepID=UPI003817099E
MSNNTPSSGHGADGRQPGEQPFNAQRQMVEGAVYGGTPQYGGYVQGGVGVSGPGHGLPAHTQLPPAPSGMKGVAIASLVCGIMSLLLAWIPVINFLALVAGVAAIVLGAVSLVKKFDGKVMAWTGKGLGLLGIVVTVLIIVLAILGNMAISSGLGPLQKYNEDQNTQVSVKYIVTTSTPTDVSVAEPTGDSDVTVSKDYATEFTAQGKDILRVSATSTDREITAAKVTCEILIDGTSVAKESGEGKGASAACAYYQGYSSSTSDKTSKDVSVEFKVTPNSQASVDSSWSASGDESSSNRTFDATTDSTNTVQAKSDGRLSLYVRNDDWSAGNPSYGCEILVDGKSVSKQQSNSIAGTAHCTYTPPGN